MTSSQDPFHFIKKDIQDTVNDLQTKFARWSGLSSSSPERLNLGGELDRGCASVSWQLDELENAIEKASMNPSRFNLNQSELDNRQSWVRSTRGQVSNIEKSVKVANERARHGDGQHMDSVNLNESFVTDQRMEQQQIIRRQDEDLDAMGEQVQRLGQVGLTIHEELSTQQEMLDELDEDVDITANRMKAAQRKIAEIIKKSGGKKQFLLILCLILVFVVLVVIAFM